MSDQEIEIRVERITRATIRTTTTDYKVGEHYLIFEDDGVVRLINHDDIREIEVRD